MKKKIIGIMVLGGIAAAIGSSQIIKLTANSNDEGKEIKETSNVVTNQDVNEEVWTKEALDKYFLGWDDDTIVLQIDGGGFISSSVNPDSNFKVISEDGTETIYNIAKDENSETVGEAKQRLLGTKIYK